MGPALNIFSTLKRNAAKKNRAASAPDKKRCARASQKSRISRKALALALSLSFVSPAASFTGPREARASIFGEFSIAQEAELGRKFNVLIRSRMPLVMDPEVVEYLDYLLERLSEGMPPQPFKYQVSLIRHNAINAFAVPGGYLFIHTGLLLGMKNEAEVASVLAHEMAHVSQRHIASRMESQQKVTMLSMLGMLAGAFLGGEAGNAALYGSAAASQAAMLNYSRSDESEADQVGMNYLLAAGYDPQSMVEAFKVLQRPQWVSGSEIPSYLSTHPAIPERISEISGRISASKRAKVRPTDENRFIRIQTLIRGRYGTPAPSMQYFKEQANGPNKALAYFGTAILHDRQHKVNEATRAYKEAMRLAPGDQLIIREAGIFHYRKGDTGEAVRLLQEALRLNPNDYMGGFYYARLLSDSGKDEQAVDYYRQILRRFPEESDVHYYYAQSLGRSKQLFLAHLHLAYSAMYENNKGKTAQALARAKKEAKTDKDKAALELFQKRYDERKAFWD